MLLSFVFVFGESGVGSLDNGRSRGAYAQECCSEGLKSHWDTNYFHSHYYSQGSGTKQFPFLTSTLEASKGKSTHGLSCALLVLSEINQNGYSQEIRKTLSQCPAQSSHSITIWFPSSSFLFNSIRQKYFP